jgi:lsr operon transcriptional repressor
MAYNRTGTSASVLTRVARLYYEHGLTHAEIAEILGVSRVKVTRMLTEARRQGVVEIRVHGDTGTFTELESSLVHRQGLRDAWVVPSSSDTDRLRTSLGIGGAHSLRALLAPRMTVGVNQSRTVAAILPALRNENPVDADFVPVSGSRGGVGGAKAHYTSEAMARAFDCSAHHLPAPVLASSAQTAAVLRAEAEIAETLALAARADLLIVGVGTLEDNHLAHMGELSVQDIESLRKKGVVGDMSSRFFDADGQPVALSVDDRVIALTLDEHRAIPMRVAIAGGPAKREALKAAARGRLYNVLVTDADTAAWLVEHS